ncbi:hypothetical protein RDWZM_009609 [Blomia tropicalis]|uniref:Uncharacterized protein n=1 Tax=Blomia tropicalis TaxID=40697 RepID=A0A9Q0M3W0_BLOTA|nr:hypothetical protein RDWZM_009609 [Blomia tropicalis]
MALYTINQSLSDIHLHGMNLVNVAPVPIEKQWTPFKNSKRFAEIKNKITMIYSTPTGQNVSFFVFNVPNEIGLTYNPITNELVEGYNYSTKNDGYKAPITGRSFYTIEHSNNGPLSFVDWEFYIGSTDSNIFKLDSTTRRSILYNSKNKSLVLGNDTRDGYQRLSGIEWPVLNGFISENRIILFTPKTIYNFSQGIDQGWHVPVTSIDLSAFFICNAAQIITGPPQNQSTEKPRIWLIALVVILALAILFTIGMISYQASRKAKNRHKKRKKKKNGSISQTKALPETNKNSSIDKEMSCSVKPSSQV